MIPEPRYLLLVWFTGLYAVVAALAGMHLLLGGQPGVAALWAAQALVFGPATALVVRGQRRARRRRAPDRPPSTEAEDRAFRERFGDTSPRPVPRHRAVAPGARVLPPVPVVPASRPAPPRPPRPEPDAAPDGPRPTPPATPLTTGDVVLAVGLGSFTPLVGVLLLGHGLTSGSLRPWEVLALALVVVPLSWLSGGGLVVGVLRDRSRQRRGPGPLRRPGGRETGADTDVDTGGDLGVDLDVGG
ncbi:hypothetical protein [Kineococcus sp. SYSU DK003]|uniref:hypothetical protein n=1 Tax=Kineococcus sp. SYSU DK003 TaxID=3383124 RepID=UPI003D7C8F48